MIEAANFEPSAATIRTSPRDRSGAKPVERGGIDEGFRLECVSVIFTRTPPSLGSNPALSASLTPCFWQFERAGETQPKTPRFLDLRDTAGLAPPTERRQAGESVSDAAEFLCRALMHWRNSADVHRPGRCDGCRDLRLLQMPPLMPCGGNWIIRWA
jgi:hypothetical protein